MNTKFVRIGDYVINLDQITHIYRRCPNDVTISITTSSTEPTGTLDADYIQLRGEEAEAAWAYFSSMMVCKTLSTTRVPGNILKVAT